MAIKKSALYSFLWSSCDELRGGMDVSQYKDYVLTLLFVKYVSPAKNGDYAFLLHIVKSLKSTGKGAVILPHGVLFRGHAEAAHIRRNLIRQGLIKGIIGLPANLFYGTAIPERDIVLDKENAQARQSIFMIDASKGYMKDGNKNRLFAGQQQGIKVLETQRDAISREREEPEEEHSGEEGLLEEAKTDKGKLTKASVNARLKELLADEVDASLRSLSTLPNAQPRRVDKRSASTIKAHPP